MLITIYNFFNDPSPQWRYRMKISEMNKLTKHFDRYFEADDCMVAHPTDGKEPHIDVLKYRPTAKYPFWKLATMGASDYKMPKISNTLGCRNEYIMFVDKDVDLDDKEVYIWYHDRLCTVAMYAFLNKTHITYAHCIDWKGSVAKDSGGEDEEMVAAFIEFPMVIEDVALLDCRMGLFKAVTCLEVLLINDAELEMLMKIGPQAFSEYLYPEEGGKIHFLSERHRSEKF